MSLVQSTETTFQEALRVIADERRPLALRKYAADVATALFDILPQDERHRTDMFHALSHALDVPLIVGLLIRAVGGARAWRGAWPAADPMLPALAIAARKACAGGHQESLGVLVLAMLARDAPASTIDQEWAVRLAERWSLARDVNSLRRLVQCWVNQFGGRASWVGDAVHQFPRMFDSNVFDISVLESIIKTAPSAAVWAALARRLGPKAPLRIATGHFEVELDEAILALTDAIDQTRKGREAPDIRLTLTRWLVKIAGDELGRVTRGGGPLERDFDR